MESKQLWVLCSVSFEEDEVAEILEVYDNRDDAQVRWDEEVFSVNSELEDNGVDEPDEYVCNRDDMFFETRYNGDIWRVIVNEVKRVFDMECSSQTDWFWDGSTPYDHYYEGDDTYVLTNDEAVCVVTLREVEI